MSAEAFDYAQLANIPPLLLLIYLVNSRLVEIREEIKKQSQIILEKIAPQKFTSSPVAV